MVWFLFACFFAVCLFGSSEDDVYVDKLPTFERHFDSFAGRVKHPPLLLHMGTGGGLGKGLVSACFESFWIWMLFTRSAVHKEG